MRPRVTARTLKRLEQLDAPWQEGRARVLYMIAMRDGVDSLPPAARRELTLAQRTVLSWPRISLDLDAWERESSKQQEALIASAAEDRGQRGGEEPVVVGPDPADRTAAYKPTPVHPVPLWQISR